MAAAKDNNRTLLFETDRGTLHKITIPADFKVTFGKQPSGDKYSGGGSNQLRIYEMESKQRAVFNGVKTFRDLSLPFETLVSEIDGESTWSDDGKGNSKKQSQHKTKDKWV